MSTHKTQRSLVFILACLKNVIKVMQRSSLLHLRSYFPAQAHASCLRCPKMHFSTTFIVTIFLAIAGSSGAKVSECIQCNDVYDRPRTCLSLGVSSSSIRQAANTVHGAANTIQHNAQTIDNAVHSLLSRYVVSLVRSYIQKTAC